MGKRADRRRRGLLGRRERGRLPMERWWGQGTLQGRSKAPRRHSEIAKAPVNNAAGYTSRGIMIDHSLHITVHRLWALTADDCIFCDFSFVPTIQ